MTSMHQILFFVLESDSVEFWERAVTGVVTLLLTSRSSLFPVDEVIINC